MKTIGETADDEFWKRLKTELQVPNKKYLDVPEAANYLRMSQKFIYTNKDIPRFKVGARNLLFSIEDLDNWLELNKEK